MSASVSPPQADPDQPAETSSRPLSRRTVRGRLIGMMLLTTFVALLITAFGMLAHEMSVYQQSWASNLATEANILAFSTGPALAFDDRDVAERNLAALQARPEVQAAALYTPDGRLYARYVRAGFEPPPLLLLDASEGMRTGRGRVELSRRVIQGEEWLGTIYLRAQYDVAGRIRAYSSILALVMLLSMATAFALSATLQRLITGPLHEIAGLARRIVERRDFSLRLRKHRDDEFGVVSDALNSMLDEVQAGTRALAASNDSLRSEVGEREAAQAALALANARLQSTMAAAEIGGFVWDLRRNEFVADRNFAALYGREDEHDFLTDPQLRRRHIHPDDQAAVAEAEAQALRTGVLTSTEYRIVRPDGALRWVMARGQVQKNEQGEPQLFAGLLIDATAQKTAEQRLRESERLYRAIGESINYGVWVCDAQGRCTYVSDSFLRLTGLTQEQCSAYGWSSVVHPDDAEEMLAAWRECVRSGGSWYREHRVRGVDGEYHPLLAQGVPVHSEDGSLWGWAGINLDISRLKQTEEALRDADRRKDEFLATLAHELRNPLAPVRNAARLLDLPKATDQQRSWAREVIGRQVQHMALLLDDLLDVSRITRGRLELKKDFIALDELVAAAVETARPLIESRKHTLEIDLPPTSVGLNVDPLRMSQALSNLLTNAAKYTDPGGQIHVSARATRDELTISVRDTGIGLTETAIPKVFEMFSQVESAIERSQGGLGIGLALVKGLVTLHGGAVEAASDGLGLGSTFTIRLNASSIVQPPENVQSLASTALEQTVGPRCRVLVADDNRDAADSLAMVLQTSGFDVLIAHSGAEALQMVESARPDAYVLDVGMPEMSGYELAQRIRKTTWGEHALLVAVTGWGQREDKDQARAAGFDQHFTKPVDVLELESCLAAYAAMLAARGRNERPVLP